jgi:hypothetical protein
MGPPGRPGESCPLKTEQKGLLNLAKCPARSLLEKIVTGERRTNRYMEKCYDERIAHLESTLKEILKLQKRLSAETSLEPKDPISQTISKAENALNRPTWARMRPVAKEETVKIEKLYQDLFKFTQSDGQVQLSDEDFSDLVDG